MESRTSNVTSVVLQLFQYGWYLQSFVVILIHYRIPSSLCILWLKSLKYHEYLYIARSHANQLPFIWLKNSDFFHISCNSNPNFWKNTWNIQVLTIYFLFHLAPTITWYHCGYFVYLTPTLYRKYMKYIGVVSR